MEKFGAGFNTTTVHDHRSPVPPTNDWWRFLPPEKPVRLSLNQGNHGGTLVGDDVGSTLGMFSAVPGGGSSVIHPRHDHDHDDVDLTLTLSLPGIPINPNPAVSAADSNAVDFSVDSRDGAVDFPIEVDTELTLGSYLLGGKKEEPTKPEETEEREKSDGLNFYPLGGKEELTKPEEKEEREKSHGGSGDVRTEEKTKPEEKEEREKSHGGAGDARTEEKKETEKKKRKRPDDAAAAAAGATEEKKRRQANRSPRADKNDEDQRPLTPIEGIPVLYQTLESRGGTGPVFLYRKKLTPSDVKKNQNRLLVTRTEKVMKLFLREEEAAAVKGGVGKGVKAVGIDCGGRVYEEMGLTKWGKVTVFKTCWRPMFEANGAEIGEVVEVWGYRENGKPCFAFNFRKDQP